MKNVRIWFKKDYECRYISHLDLNRTMLRALHKSRIPIWHTEGFNPHPFATFPLPLSLGFRGVNECMDVKLEQDNYSFEEIISKLNECLPRGIKVFDVTEAVMKAGKVAYASFTVRLSDPNTSSKTICLQLEELLSQPSIELQKKSKKGIKTVDIKPGIREYSVKENFDDAQLDIMLSAGSSNNVNPSLIIDALRNAAGVEYYADITRNDLFNSDMEPFR